jgi:transcriptional regulator
MLQELSNMYLPPAFHEKNPDVLWGVVKEHPLGLLISGGIDEITANLVPFEINLESEKAILCTHMAKANPQWVNLNGQGVLAVFQGANSYVSPQWYESKREHGRVVPTWNYAVVQVRGIARVIDDHDWLLQQVTRVTDHHEKTVTPGKAWHVTDAPEGYIQSQIKGIVGIEIEVTAITGKLKASQNRHVQDRAGVVDGLNQIGGENSLAMAELVQGTK